MDKDVEAYAREKGISVMEAQKQLNAKSKTARKTTAKQVDPAAAEEVEELGANGEE